MSSRFRWLPLVVAWTAFGLAQGLIRTAANASPAALLGVLAFDVPLALLWAAFTPVVGHWSAAVGRRTPSRALRVLAHVPLAVLAGLLYTLLRRSLAVALGNSLGVPFHVTLLFFADIVVASYVAAAWAARTMDAERARTVREQRTNLLRAQLSSARTQYLDLQLQPHFLFNTLGAISELAHEAPRSAARMIRNVIMLLQTAASRHERALVTLGEELDALQPYLEIQRLRFSDWLTIEESADVASRAALVPQFILQPLVENAVHHGLKGRTERGHIAIRARIASGGGGGGRLVIEVMDNGVGLQVAPYRERRGLGLENVRARLAAVYQMDATLGLVQQATEGTAARLDIPLQTSASAEVALPAAPGEIPGSFDGAPAGSPPLHGARLGLAVALVWGVVALFRIQHSYAYLWMRDQLTPDAIRSALRFDLVVAVVWLLLTPLVFGVIRLVPLRGGGRSLVSRAAVHVLAAIGFALLHAAVTPFALSGFQTAGWSGPARELFAWNIAIYAILLVIVHWRGVQRWTMERDVTDSRIRQELAAATFQRVVLELRPNALLDALHRLETLVTDDRKRAESVLADIGDFLRGTLDFIHERHVTLRDEANAVSAYARVLAAGAEPELDLQLCIPRALMEVPVPNGVLRAVLDASVEAGGGRVITLAVVGDDAQLAVRADAAVHAPARETTSEPARARLRAYERQGFIRLVNGTGDIVIPAPPPGGR